MIKNMKIIRQNRKSLVITVKENGEVILKAPIFISDQKIENFLNEKANWIKKQKQKFALKQKFIDLYDFENYVYVNGERYDWNEIKNRDKRITKASFYTKEFYNNIISRAEKWAKLFKREISFKLCNSKCIWGSCNATSIIKLNWKLILLPIYLQDYVIVHELCHTIELNHSPDFWKQVGRILPEYKQARNDLKTFSLLLRMNVI